MAEESGGERTESATGKRREQARNKGQVAKSQEVTGAILLLIGITVLVASGGHFMRVMGRNATYLLGESHSLSPTSVYGVRELLTGNLEVLLTTLAPLLVAVLIAGIGGNILQVGFHASAEALSFKTEKLNPISGMKRFFQKTAFFDIVKNTVKIGLITMLAWWTIDGLINEFSSTPLISINGVIAAGKGGFIKLMSRLLAFAVFVALIDWFWQKRQYEDNIKMSKHEVKQEYKELEGDPQIKARIRGLQFEMARKRMLADVPTADVVITNPTHFAVALKYVAGEAAPMVVAKGQENLAAMIRKIARKSRVPVIENKPLARALYREVEVGKTIPESLFQAAAEVLAYVYRLKKA